MRRPFSNDKSIIEIAGRTLRDTAAAIRFDHGAAIAVWLPKSQLEDWPDVGEDGELLIPEWLASEKGMI